MHVSTQVSSQVLQGLLSRNEKSKYSVLLGGPRNSVWSTLSFTDIDVRRVQREPMNERFIC